jgi:hypothetical protein
MHTYIHTDVHTHTGEGYREPRFVNQSPTLRLAAHLRSILHTKNNNMPRSQTPTSPSPQHANFCLAYESSTETFTEGEFQQATRMQWPFTTPHVVTHTPPRAEQTRSHHRTDDVSCSITPAANALRLHTAPSLRSSQSNTWKARRTHTKKSASKDTNKSSVDMLGSPILAPWPQSISSPTQATYNPPYRITNAEKIEVRRTYSNNHNHNHNNNNMCYTSDVNSSPTQTDANSTANISSFMDEETPDGVTADFPPLQAFVPLSWRKSDSEPFSLGDSGQVERLAHGHTRGDPEHTNHGHVDCTAQEASSFQDSEEHDFSLESRHTLLSDYASPSHPKDDGYTKALPLTNSTLEKRSPEGDAFTVFYFCCFCRGGGGCHLVFFLFSGSLSFVFPCCFLVLLFFGGVVFVFVFCLLAFFVFFNFCYWVLGGLCFVFMCHVTCCFVSFRSFLASFR